MTTHESKSRIMMDMFLRTPADKPMVLLGKAGSGRVAFAEERAREAEVTLIEYSLHLPIEQLSSLFERLNPASDVLLLNDFGTLSDERAEAIRDAVARFVPAGVRIVIVPNGPVPAAFEDLRGGGPSWAARQQHTPSEGRGGLKR